MTPFPRPPIPHFGSVLGGLIVLVGLPLEGLAAPQGAPLAIEEMPLAQYSAVRAGGTVTPVYEGWYDNSDGFTRTIYFGYYNRNTEEVVHVPVGPDNRVDGLLSADPDLGQPTRFEPGRHWGVFGVEVPGDFEGTLVWHLSLRGRAFEIPGETREDWSTPAISGDAIGNTPPWLAFDAEGPEGSGPAGIRDEFVRSAAAGVPVHLAVHARDDGVAGQVGAPEDPGPLSLTWFAHRGPAPVEFREADGKVSVEGGVFETDVTFTEPGQYVLRVRANDATGLAPAGHEQCCWTNGFVRFVVTPAETDR